MRTRTLEGFALGLILGLAACSDSNMGEVKLQLATRAVNADLAPADPGQVLVTAGTDEIVIDRVEIVARKVRLDGAPTASCPEDSEGDSQCAVLRLGPVLFDLPLNGGVEQTLSALVPVGTYERVNFQIHKPSDANGDAQLLAEHPDLENTSIRVTGTYNGTPFVFTTDLTEVEDVGFPAPLEVAQEAEVALTLLVDVAGWFTNADGTGLVDPSQANNGGPFESLVEQQIRASFRAFQDADQDAVAD